MKRFQDDLAHMKRQQKLWNKNDLRCEPAGAFRKKKAYDCGHARCRTCHANKIFGVVRHRDAKKLQVSE